jgi:hypothetical protein
MKRALLITTVAVALAAAAPAGAKKAYFRIDVRASQHVIWSTDSLSKGCSDSVIELHAKGTGDLRARNHNAPWAVVDRPADARRTTLLINGETPSSLSVDGQYTRTWQQNAFFSKPPSDPDLCPKSLPGSPDCGARALPAGSLMYVNYIPSGAWTYPAPKPKGGALTLTGPYIEDWVGMPPFQLCGGANGDDTLAGSWYTTQVRPLAAPLSLGKLFGKAKRFTVSYHDARTVETGRTSPYVLSAQAPVSTEIRWKVTFTRVGPQLQAPDL